MTSTTLTPAPDDGFHALVSAILRLGSAELATEEAACDALTELRFPGGVFTCHCGAPMTRHLAHVTCTAKPRKHHFTILRGTPLGRKTRPRIRPLLIGLRAMAACPRGVPARELARDVGMPHVTLWRHLHHIRALLPRLPEQAPAQAAAVLVCGKHRKHVPRAWVRAATRHLLQRLLTKGADGRTERMIGESIRTWLNGTHRGVYAQWVHNYLREAAARWLHAPLAVIAHALTPLVAGGPPIAFDSLYA